MSEFASGKKILRKIKRRTQAGTLFLCKWQLSNGSAEGLEGKLCELEALLAEGDTNEGNAKYYAKYEVYKSEYDTAAKVPENVENGALSYEGDVLAEGLENKLSHLEVLLSEGDTYDSAAENNAEKEVYCSEDESAEYAPKEITEFFHCDELLKIFIFSYVIILAQKKEKVNIKI